MYIQQWVLWLVGIVLWLGLTAFAGRSRGDYDFMSPILGGAIFLGYPDFVVAFMLASSYTETGLRCV